MYKIAKKLKILKIGVLLQNIVLPGFDTSCKGFINMNRVEKSNQRQKANLPEKETWELYRIGNSVPNRSGNFHMQTMN